ncbi:MAG: hypothetical protein RLZZ628_3813 [Bacteroidota bacterium]|jgi:hypothetical protein
MKKFLAPLFIIAFSFISLSLSAQNKGAVINFEKTEIDYGTIPQNSDGMRSVKFKNIGDQPLIIKNAVPSCGCTIPTWTTTPVMPNENGVVEVKYDTTRVGPINKTVKVLLTDGTETVLTIRGTVIPNGGGSASNSSAGK